MKWNEVEGHGLATAPRATSLRQEDYLRVTVFFPEWSKAKSKGSGLLPNPSTSSGKKSSLRKEDFVQERKLRSGKNFVRERRLRAGKNC